MRMLAAELPHLAQPEETARWLMEGELHADSRDGPRARGKLMGENTAQVLVMLVAAAVAGGGAKFAAKLPGFGRAGEWAEAQGLKLAQAGEVKAVAAAEERTFTLMVRRPGGRAAAAAEEAAETRAGITTIIRHAGGNLQVFINGQRWHVPANRSLRDIPLKDPVGDQLQAAALRIAKEWSRNLLTPKQANAIRRAREQGRYLAAHLMERRFRGQWVENVLRDQFKGLRWNHTGVDAVDPPRVFATRSSQERNRTWPCMGACPLGLASQSMTRSAGGAS